MGVREVQEVPTPSLTCISEAFASAVKLSFPPGRFSPPHFWLLSELGKKIKFSLRRSVSGVKRAAERRRESRFQQRQDGSQAGLKMEVGEGEPCGNPERRAGRREETSL